MPALQTVMGWINDPAYPEFAGMYARAREARLGVLADEIIEIADDTSRDRLKGEDGESVGAVLAEAVQRSRLRVDTRKWLLSKLAPKQYGDKIETTASADDKPRGALVVPGTYDVDSWTAAAAKEAAHQDRLRGEVLKPAG